MSGCEKRSEIRDQTSEVKDQRSEIGDQMSAIRVIVDKRGRTFEKGKALRGRPGVVVKDVRRIGNFFQVDFGMEVEPVQVPQPVVMHAGDVQAWE